MLCIREVLYLLVRYGNEIYPESMEVSDRQGDENAEGPCELLLDRFVTNDPDRTPADLPITVGDYDPQTNTTTFTLPYTVAAETERTTWQMFTPGSTGPVLLGSTDWGNTITARGDQTNVVVAGELYLFRYRFTKFKMVREIGGGKAAVNWCGRKSVTPRFGITKPVISRSDAA